MKVAKPAIFNREAAKVEGLLWHVDCFENKIERKYGREASTMGFVVCAGRFSKCMEGKCNGGVGSRRSGV